MGNGSSRVEEVEKDAFDVVHVSGNVLRRFKGADGNYYSVFPSESHFKNAKSTALALNENVGSENLPPILVDEKLRSALLEQESLANRLRRDLNQSSAEADQLRNEINRLENELKQCRSSKAFVDGDKRENISAPIDNIYYRQKLDELTKDQRRFQEIKAKELRGNVAKLEKRVLPATSDTVCRSEESELALCYMKNRKKSLECQKIAKVFTKCVEDYRSRTKIPKDECGK